MYYPTARPVDGQAGGRNGPWATMLGCILGNTPFALLAPNYDGASQETPARVHDDALISTTPRDAAWTAAATVLAVAEFVGSYER
jgi:hypothetical protein